MRKIGLIIAALTAVGGAAAGAVVIWRRNPRIGSTFVNSVVNPRLLQHGFAGGRTSEIGAIEHFGRISGIRRLTPVHPEATTEGFRIVVPLGRQSHWARNVLTAGHCRLQLHDIVYDLDEPALIPASDVDALPTAVRSGHGGARVRIPHLANLRLEAGYARTSGRRGTAAPRPDPRGAIDPRSTVWHPRSQGRQFRRLERTGRSSPSVSRDRPRPGSMDRRESHDPGAYRQGGVHTLETQWSIP